MEIDKVFMWLLEGTFIYRLKGVTDQGMEVIVCGQEEELQSSVAIVELRAIKKRRVLKLCNRGRLNHIWVPTGVRSSFMLPPTTN